MATRRWKCAGGGTTRTIHQLHVVRVAFAVLALCAALFLWSIIPSSPLQGRSVRTTSYSKPPLVIFRYDFGGGGVGDCLKGMVATLQLALLTGCGFRVDFSRHPFDRALELVAGVAADDSIRVLDKDDVRVFNIGDWHSSPERRMAFEFAA